MTYRYEETVQPQYITNSNYVAMQCILTCVKRILVEVYIHIGALCKKYLAIKLLLSALLSDYIKFSLETKPKLKPKTV